MTVAIKKDPKKVNLGANWIMGEKNPLLEYFKFGEVKLEKIPCNADDYDDIQILDFSENPNSVNLNFLYHIMLDLAVEYNRRVQSVSSRVPN